MGIRDHGCFCRGLGFGRGPKSFSFSAARAVSKVETLFPRVAFFPRGVTHLATGVAPLADRVATPATRVSHLGKRVSTLAPRFAPLAAGVAHLAKGVATPGPRFSTLAQRVSSPAAGVLTLVSENERFTTKTARSAATMPTPTHSAYAHRLLGLKRSRDVLGKSQFKMGIAIVFARARRSGLHPAFSINH